MSDQLQWLLLRNWTSFTVKGPGTPVFTREPVNITQSKTGDFTINHHKQDASPYQVNKGRESQPVKRKAGLQRAVRTAVDATKASERPELSRPSPVNPELQRQSFLGWESAYYGEAHLILALSNPFSLLLVPLDLNHDAGIDFSDTLREETSWNPGLLYDFKLSPTPSVPTAITAMSVDGALGLLAVGTFTGKIHIFGAAPVATTLLIPAPNEHAAREEVKFLGFCASVRRLVCIDGANVLHVWDLVDLQAEEPTPPSLLEDSSFEIPENVTVLSTSPLHSHNHDAGIDFSDTLREETSWNPGLLYDFKLSPTPSVPTAITAMSVDGALGLLAVGTFTGKIHIFGAAPVATTLLIPAPNEHAAREEVKFLGFCASVRRLVCVDGANVLHVWDLVDLQAEEPTPPSLLDDSSFAIPENVTVLSTSPLHSHAFIALQSGEIMTFDVDRLCPSPYVIPNAWLEHQEVLNRTSEAIEHRVPTVMDIVPHPRDLNLLFIAYDGEQYWLNVRVGCSRGSLQAASSYGIYWWWGIPGRSAYPYEREWNQAALLTLFQDLFTERYPPATSLSVHPSGHIISVGHLDGCISFWAVEDDDRPLAVRTLSEPFSFIDVNVPDPMALIDDLNDEDASSESPPRRQQQREPIFRLAWSGFPDFPPPKDPLYGAFASTTLTILGGTTASDQQGVTVLNFPGLVLPTPDMTAGPMSPSFSTRDISSCQIMVFQEREVFGRLVSGFVNNQNSEPMAETNSGRWIEGLRGGSGWSDFSGENAPDARLSKFDRHRMMIVSHSDLTVRFYDISSQLLLSTEPLRFEFPQVLPHLTLELARIIPLLPPVDTLEIQSVHLASISAECAVVLSTGHVAIWRLREPGSPSQTYNIPSEDSEVFVPLDPFVRRSERYVSSFQPFCLIRPPETEADTSVEVTASALSDVGFLAVAYRGNSLAVFDLRFPKVTLRTSRLPKSGDKDKLGPVTTLTWSFCGLGSDAHPRLRLIASHQHGITRVITLHVSPNSKDWEVVSEAGGKSVEAGHCYEAERSSPVDPLISTVIDGRKGGECLATPAAIVKAESDDPANVPTKNEKTELAHCFWVVGGTKEARCFENITGNQVGHVEWASKSKGFAGAIQTARVISRSGYQVLAVFHDGQKVSLYSLPDLDFIRVLDIQPSQDPTSTMTIACDQEGDYLILMRSEREMATPSLHYGTLFDFRRLKRPLIDLGEPRLQSPDEYPVPSLASLLPQNTAGSFSSWIWGAPKLLRGPELDALLAGPDRPPARTIRSENPPRDPAERVIRHKGIAPAKQPGARPDLYSRLRSAAAERGEALEDLGEKFSALESASKDMAGQAKKLAAQQAARSWFPRFG
ncbi:hypothetical protein M407DRAFT_11057 [Tulasnella calospora MUT 4182]|uniref:Lethal giant larvae (Lgl)-like C-terminal domain-containing protein n=1 Tax=Tulasnella calospora MUT 4182 TaxID=1051891 RepID=A0A0C3KF74_9AGAM|nr:hypothetical protein M407DRAFT_11057 [Tulasnella calospora MUT 4182]